MKKIMLTFLVTGLFCLVIKFDFDQIAFAVSDENSNAINQLNTGSSDGTAITG